MSKEVFISFSGDESKKFSKKLKVLIENVFEKKDKVFFSDESLNVGENWFEKIYEALKSVKIGIICLTKENINSSHWLFLEYGAFVYKYRAEEKDPKEFKVIPIFLNFTKDDWDKNPLNDIQGISFKDKKIEEVITEILMEINKGFKNSTQEEDVERNIKESNAQIVSIKKIIKNIDQEGNKEELEEKYYNEKNIIQLEKLTLLNDLYKIIGESNVPFNIPEISDKMRMRLRKLFQSELDFIEIKFSSLGQESVRHIRITENGLNHLAENI